MKMAFAFTVTSGSLSGLKCPQLGTSARKRKKDVDSNHPYCNHDFSYQHKSYVASLACDSLCSPAYSCFLSRGFAFPQQVTQQNVLFWQQRYAVILFN